MTFNYSLKPRAESPDPAGISSPAHSGGEGIPARRNGRLHPSSFILHPFLLCASLLFIAVAVQAQVRNIVSVDYAVDGGSYTTVDVVDAPSVNWLQSVPTTGLLDGLHRVHVRGTDDLGRTGAITDGIFGTISNSLGQTRVMTNLQYAVDAGTFTNVDIPDGPSANWLQSIPTTGLADGLHRVHVRGTDDLGRTGVVTDGFFATISNPGGGQTRMITQLSYQFDNGAFTNVDVTDAPSVNWADVLPTTGLAEGIHQVRVRGTDDLGRTGVVTAGFFGIISNAFTGQSRLVTQLEYRFDSDPYTVVDVTDAGIVPWNQLLSTSALAIGLHRLDVRCTDDLGRVGQPSRTVFVATSPVVAGQPRTITAAEFFVNSDPGAGNGIAIPLPNDGAYDEGQEDVDTVLTGIPIGLHRIGFRTRDDLNRWSSPVIDSLLVGPVLVVRSSGTNIILDWQSGSGADQFKIYRSALPTSGFALIDSTTSSTYTDVGIAAIQLKRFYQVTFETSGFSPFSMPDHQPFRD